MSDVIFCLSIRTVKHVEIPQFTKPGSHWTQQKLVKWSAWIISHHVNRLMVAVCDHVINLENVYVVICQVLIGKSFFEWG